MSKIFKFCFFIALFAIEFLATTSKKVAVNEIFWDKTNHILAFFTLYVLLHFGFRLKILNEILLLITFGIQIEIIQSFLPNRSFSAFDIAADLIGILSGVLVVKILNLNSEFKKFTEKF